MFAAGLRPFRGTMGRGVVDGCGQRCGLLKSARFLEFYGCQASYAFSKPAVTPLFGGHAGHLSHDGRVSMHRPTGGARPLQTWSRSFDITVSTLTGAVHLGRRIAADGLPTDGHSAHRFRRRWAVGITRRIAWGVPDTDTVHTLDISI
jgi:hypothetical protein